MRFLSIFFVIVAIICVSSVMWFDKYKAYFNKPSACAEPVQAECPACVDKSSSLQARIIELESEITRMNKQQRALRKIEGKQNRVKMQKCVAEKMKEGVAVWAYKPPGESNLYCVYDKNGNVEVNPDTLLVY